MKEMEQAQVLNPNFKEWTPQQQFQFIKNEINPNIIPQEITWYYDRQWGCPLEHYEIQNKINMNYANKH
ncbi:MAG: hypothetical protein GY775_16845 [Candidatus Scalindua sp.]|nr:hypothetical protein [Candidatus Scalindua sp.]